MIMRYLTLLCLMIMVSTGSALAAPRLISPVDTTNGTDTPKGEAQKPLSDSKAELNGNGITSIPNGSILISAEAVKQIIAERDELNKQRQRISDLSAEKENLNGQLKQKEEQIKEIPALIQAQKQLRLLEVEAKKSEAAKIDIQTLKKARIDLTEDLAALTHYVQKNKYGDKFKAADLGTFNVVTTPLSIYVFLPPDRSAEADTYFNNAIKRKYEDATLLLYVLDKKEIAVAPELKGR